MGNFWIVMWASLLANIASVLLAMFLGTAFFRSLVDRLQTQ